jgi:hypothetical protein
MTWCSALIALPLYAKKLFEVLKGNQVRSMVRKDFEGKH